jgi:uncharacterized protein
VNAFSWTESKGDDEQAAGDTADQEQAGAEVPPDPLAPFVTSGPVMGPARPAKGGGRTRADAPGSHPNAQRIRDCYAALEKRDLETAFRDFSPTFKLEVPAQLPFDPGDVRGPMVVMGLVRKMLELTGGQFKNELLTVTATDDMAVALNRVTVSRRGATRVYHTSWTYRVVGDKIVEGWLHVSLSPDDLRTVFS